MSRPVVTEHLERAVRPHFRLGELERLRPGDWRGQKFVLRTDISQFYPSLYTHSIPWALEGKAVAKRSRGRTRSDRLDKALREVTDGQTIGVPIGPDTSFLAAEIVLTAVDKILATKMPRRGHRYIDDYELAFATRSEAEEAQAVFEEVLAEFELAVNLTKTEILQLPQPYLERWTHELSTFQIRDIGVTQTITDLIALFSRASEIAPMRSGALKYALLCCRDIEVDDQEVWSALQSLVWSAVSAEPTTMATALDLLAMKADEGGFGVDKEAAAEVIEALIRAHSPIQNASEVAWGVWAAIALEIEMTGEAAVSISTMADDFVALLALDASERGLFGDHELDKSQWESLTDFDDVLNGPHWLLAYEGGLRKWIEAPVPRITADDHFKVLKKRGIHFYDEDPSRNPFTGPAGPLPGGLVPDEYV